MWAQLIKARVKPGKQDEIEQVQKEFERRSADGSTGWVRSYGFQNQNEPDEYYTLVFFESEEKARQNERNPEQQVMVQKLMDLFDGPPSFVDLIPMYEGSR